MLSIALMHPQMGHAGSEARVLRMLESLSGDYAVSLVTIGQPDLARLNSQYRTALQKDQFAVVSVPVPFWMRPLVRFDPVRGSWYARFCRKIAREYDVVISTYNFVDFGIRAIQCVADFCFDEHLREQWGHSLE